MSRAKLSPRGGGARGMSLVVSYVGGRVEQEQGGVDVPRCVVDVGAQLSDCSCLLLPAALPPLCCGVFGI